MRFCFVPVAEVYRRSSIPGALLGLAVALFIGCGSNDGTGPKETPPIQTIDLSVSGQTVTKVRTAGSKGVLLEQRLTSILEGAPQRTLTILESDGHTLQPYMPPPGW